jgi:hypothetical protein
VKSTNPDAGDIISCLGYRIPLHVIFCAGKKYLGIGRGIPQRISNSDGRIYMTTSTPGSYEHFYFTHSTGVWLVL